MPITWTAEQIVAMAPDTASAKAGKDLAVQRKWVTLGTTEEAAWGECQGSSSKPYQTQIDLSEPAFRCSCPSRKFPCKHGLGLLLLLEKQPAAFTQTETPDWVKDWIDGRAKKAEQKARRVEKQADPESQPDPAAQAKRAAQREAKVAAGMKELELWLSDQMRHGLAALQREGYAYWDTPAARMVDAQSPGIARILRDMAGIGATGSGWESRMLEQFGRLQLLVEGYKRLDTLPQPVQADVRSRIGWTQNQDELLAQPGVSDTWAVLGQRVEEEDRLRVQRTWLVGRTTGKRALILDFSAHSSQPLDKSLVPNTQLEAELVFYPGNFPLRALVKQRIQSPTVLTEIPSATDIAVAIEAYAQGLAAHPWLELFPMMMSAVVPVPKKNDTWLLRDVHGQSVPVARKFSFGWQLLALSGGHPCQIFGEWNGREFLPVSLWIDDTFVHFDLAQV
ncbi:MAG TPA: SWIM zinc finger family protein [Acidobacteriota bacterium]|nr:SWIM zinc finger family protein [Acidobacteriota bacterium]